MHRGDLAPLPSSKSYLWTRYSTLSLTRTVRPPAPEVIDAPAATTEWPDDPRPVGELESGDGAGRARATRARPRGVSPSGAARMLLGAPGDISRDAVAPIGSKGAAEASGNAGEEEEGKAFAVADRRTAAVADGLLLISAEQQHRPEVEAALCDVALISEGASWIARKTRRGGENDTCSRAKAEKGGMRDRKLIEKESERARA